MELIARRTLLVSLLLGSAAIVEASPKTRRVKLHVPGWSCGSCAIETSDNVGALVGVERIITRIRSKHLFVVYTPEKVSLNDILAAVKKTGYVATQDPEATWPRLASGEKRRIIHLR